MPVIFLEDLDDIVNNKYLAVNIAAQRARHLNEKELPVLNLSPRKPASVALEELIEGKIGYRKVDKLADPSDVLAIFDVDTDEITEADAEDLEELSPSNVYYVEDSSLKDPDEPEEGL